MVHDLYSCLRSNLECALHPSCISIPQCWRCYHGNRPQNKSKQNKVYGWYSVRVISAESRSFIIVFSLYLSMTVWEGSERYLGEDLTSMPEQNIWPNTVSTKYTFHVQQCYLPLIAVVLPHCMFNTIIHSQEKSCSVHLRQVADEVWTQIICAWFNGPMCQDIASVGPQVR